MDGLLSGVLVGGVYLVIAVGWRRYAGAGGWRERRCLLEALQLSTYRRRLPDFDRELNRARRTDRQLSMVVLALDVGTSGATEPQRGEPLLERLAYLLVGSMLRELLREHDIVAYDPATDRHVLLLIESDRSQAGRLIARIRAEVEARTSLALRGGIAQLPEDGLTIRDLVRHASDRCNAWRPNVDRAEFPVDSPGPQAANSPSQMRNTP
jgi:GGDEF domain-containing protein